MAGSVLVKLENLEPCITLRTISKKHGKSSRFFIVRDTFAAWLNNSDGLFHDADGSSFLTARHVDDIRVMLTITWLSGNPDAIHGWRESITLKKMDIQRLLFQEVQKMTLLYQPHYPAPTFDFRRANYSLHDCISAPVKRRALSKALRDFGWHSTHLTMYSDGTCGFGFSTNDTCPIRGGLILHNGEKKTPNGSFAYVYYGTHT